MNCLAAIAVRVVLVHLELLVDMSITNWWRNQFKSDHEIAAEELRDVVDESGADAISELESGQTTTLTGVVQSLVFPPSDKVSIFEIELFDGYGFVSIKFLGRTQIAGIKPGANIAVTGRIVRCDGKMTMFNPNYQLLPKAEI